MKKKILLVEDEAIIAISESQMLQKHGFEVVTAYKGEGAIEIIDELPDISLILMDIDLGKGIDGTEAAQRILEKKDLPVVFLSSHTEAEVVEKTEGITSYGYIVKNSGETVMLASIRMAFRLYDAHIELRKQKENLRQALVKQERTEEKLLEKSDELERYFKSSLDLLCIATTEGELVRLNPEWEKVLGYSISELEGCSFFDFVHEEDKPATRQALSKLDNQEEVQNFENRYRCKDGTYRWIEWRSQPIGNMIYAAARDVTDRKKAEQKLREGEEKYRMLYENAPMPYQSLDENGCFLEVNPAWLETLGGYTKDEIIGKSFAEFIHPDSFEDFRRNLEKFKREGKAENNLYKIRKKNGEYIDASFKGCIAYSQEGKFQRTHCVFEDITQLKKTEDRLKSHAQRLELTMKGARIAWWEMDVKTGEVRFSKQKVDMLGYDQKDFRHYEHFTELIHPDDYQNAMNAMRAHLDGRTDRYDIEYRIRTSSGEWRWFHDFGSVVSRDSERSPLRVSGIVIDVTQQKENELLIEKSRASLKTILDSIPEDIYIVEMNSFKILFMNEQLRQSFPAAHIGDICYEVFRGYKGPCSHCTNAKLFDKDGTPVEAIVWEGRNPVNGNWYINYDKAIQWVNGTYVRLQIAADITKRKNMELVLQKQKEEYELIFNNSMEGILFSSPDGNIISANKAACEFLEASEKEITQKGRAGIVDSNDTRVDDAIEKRKKYGNFRGELNFVKSNGEVFPVELTSQVFNNPEGELRTCIFFHDISEQKRKENELIDTLKQKDYLMKELNHRVKNNLNMVNSLIDLKDGEIDESLSDIHTQINAISLVHQKLQAVEDVSKIDIKAYLQDLLEAVFASFSDKSIKINIKTAQQFFQTNQVIPIGLLVNEIATNAVKHGFNNEQEPQFTLDLSKSEKKQFVLQVSNTGNAFPEDIDIKNPKTLGMQLIVSLVEQIDGTLALQKSPYPVYTIRFPSS